MSLIKNIKDNPEKLVILLLVIGFLVPLAGFISMSTCDKGSVNDCLYATRFVFPDFFYQYNTIRYIYHYGAFPSYLIVSDLGGEDGTSSNGIWRSIYHAPLYYFFGALIFFIAKKIDSSPLFWLYASSLAMAFFINLFFYLNIKYISKKVYKMINKRFIVYSMLLLFFLPVHLFLSNGLQSDIPSYLLFMVSVFYYFKLLEHQNIKYSTTLGIILGLSLLVRIASLTIIGGFILQMAYFHFKKEKKLRNYMVNSLLICGAIGIYPFIRNIILYKNPLGDIKYDLALRVYNNVVYTIFRVFRAYWGGIFGSNDHIKLLVQSSVIMLCLLLILGLFIYFRKYRNYYLNLIILVCFSTLVISFVYMCELTVLLKQGVCKGVIIQDRYLFSLNPLIAIFVSISLISIRNRIKNKILKVIPDIFVVSVALLFVIDFLTAIFILN